MSSPLRSHWRRIALVAAVLLQLPAAGANEPSPQARAHYDAGMTHKKAKAYEAAVSELREALAVCPDYGDAQWALAWTFVALDRREEAAEAFRGVIASQPDGPHSEGARAAIRRLGAVAPSSISDETRPQEADRPAVFVKEGETVFHCDHSCKALQSEAIGVARRSYPNPLAAAREGFTPCPVCKPVPDDMMPALKGILVQRERDLRTIRPITCDRFQVRVEWNTPEQAAILPTLLVSIDTDLPAYAQVGVKVYRQYYYEDPFGEQGQTEVDYASPVMAAGDWRTPRQVVLDDAKWDRDYANLHELDLTMGCTTTSIDPGIVVWAHFFPGQEDRRFDRHNGNVTGQAIKPFLAFGDYCAESELRIRVPYRGASWWLVR